MGPVQLWVCDSVADPWRSSNAEPVFFFFLQQLLCLPEVRLLRPTLLQVVVYEGALPVFTLKFRLMSHPLARQPNALKCFFHNQPITDGRVIIPNRRYSRIPPPPPSLSR